MSRPLPCLVLLSLALAACGGAPKSATMGAAPMAAPAEQPPPLDHSVFARDPDGQLGEDQIQQILDARLELKLPARVGVLPVIAAADWRGPSPEMSEVPAAVAPLVDKLRGSEHFTLVTEMMPIPSGALGMEALRETAARYKLRYVLLYREDTRSWTRSNAWSAGYATLIGATFLPGRTLHVDGFVEASLFDVKTGLLLFTVRRRVGAVRRSNEWHLGDKLGQMRTRLAVGMAPKLADDIRKAAYRLTEAIAIEDAQPAPPPEAPEPVTSAALTP
jgi:hypothetical protein